MDRVLLRYPGINAEGEDSQTLYMMRNHGGIHWLDELEDFIKRAAQNYYDGTPNVPDEIFNVAVNLLKVNDPTNKLLTTTGWGYEPDDQKVNYFGLYFHNPPMRSIALEDRYDLKKVLAEGRQLLRAPFVTMPKYNGGSGRSYFEGGHLKRVLTRSNGTKGLDVIDNFILGKSIPDYVEEPDLKWVDGEFIVSRTDFSTKINHSTVASKTALRDLAVNLSEGLMNDLDHEKCLKFIAYNSNIMFGRASGLDYLSELGFQTAKYKLCNTWTDFTELAQNSSETAQLFGDYEVDGFILRNDIHTIAIKL